MPLTSTLALAAIPIAFTLERVAPLRPQHKRWIAQSLIRVFYPALILGTLTLRLSRRQLIDLDVLPLLGAAILGLGYCVGAGLSTFCRFQSSQSERSFRFIATLPNYSYLPLVVSELLWGAEGMSYVMLLGIGTDLFLWSLAVPLLSAKDGKPKTDTFPLRRLWRLVKPLFNPPLIALFLALLCKTPWADAWQDSLTAPANILAWVGRWTLPLSMFLLGTALGQPRAQQREPKAQTWLLLWRLLLSPLLWFLGLQTWTFLPGPAMGVILLVAGMPGAIVSIVLSEIKDGDPAFASEHVLKGHLAWLVTGPLWMGLAHLFFPR